MFKVTQIFELILITFIQIIIKVYGWFHLTL